MKKCILPALALALLLSSCSSPPKEEDTLRVLCTTYPVYLFTTAVTGEADGVEVELLVNAQTSCLHDYTLTVKDMKAIEDADVIVMNGAGLEDFMADALAHSSAAVIDCSEAVELLPAPGHEDHHGHDHDEPFDPHFWMDPHRAVGIMGAVSLKLSQMVYGEDWAGHDEFHNAFLIAKDRLNWACQGWEARLEGVDTAPLITFHDGFQYFADSFGLELLESIEEEEGSTASAKEIRDITELVEREDIPAIFTERSGSSATAKVIARETGCAVYELDLLMSGEGRGIQSYLDAMDANIQTICSAFAGRGDKAP